MSPELARPMGWEPRRWLGSIVLILAVELGLIFWLSEKTVNSRPASGAGWSWRIAGPGWGELLALEDPTLFLLPHWHNFSGLAWMNTPKVPASSFVWSEEPRWLGLHEREMGSLFNRFLATNYFRTPPTLALEEPVMALPELPKAANLSATSSFRIEGPLSRRAIIKAPSLRSWPHTELLTNSVVQIVVDPEGRPVSPGTLLVSSGYAAADQFALEQVRIVRFHPLGENVPVTLQNDLTWGTLVFEWATLPATATNGSASASRP